MDGWLHNGFLNKPIVNKTTVIKTVRKRIHTKFKFMRTIISEEAATACRNNIH